MLLMATDPVPPAEAQAAPAEKKAEPAKANA